MEFTGISLFTGAGGMDIGFKEAGIQTIAANEMDKSAFATYKLNNKGVEYLEGDINNHLDDLIKYKAVDIVYGGPPCQGFSVAGKMDADDPRSQLVFSFARAIENIKPKAFVMENVKALGKLNKFENVRQKLLSQFYDLGYDCKIVLLNAKDFGVPQSRERVFFIGIKNGEGIFHESLLDKYKENAPTIRETIAHLGKAGSKHNSKICNAKITMAKNPILRKSPYAGMMFNGQGRPINPDGWSSTLPASMGGNRTPIIDERHLYDFHTSWLETHHKSLMENKKIKNTLPKYIRRLTIDEALLLQTFPSDYQFVGSQSKVYSQIGNAVPIKLAKAVGSAVIAALTHNSK